MERNIVLQRGVIVEGVVVSGGSVPEGEGESGAVHSTLSPQMIVVVIITLCVCCIVSKKGKQRENTQAHSPSDSMYRFMDSQEQEANSYTKYGSQKPYLERSRKRKTKNFLCFYSSWNVLIF